MIGITISLTLPIGGCVYAVDIEQTVHQEVGRVDVNTYC